MNILRNIMRFLREHTAWSALAATTILALVGGIVRLLGLADPGHPFATRWSGGIIEAWGTIQDFWILWITALVFGVMSLGGSASLVKRAPFLAITLATASAVASVLLFLALQAMIGAN